MIGYILAVYSQAFTWYAIDGMMSVIYVLPNGILRELHHSGSNICAYRVQRGIVKETESALAASRMNSRV